MAAVPLEPGRVLLGPLFHEPMRVETVRSAGPAAWVVGLVGLQTERFRSVNLSAQDLERLQVHDASATYCDDGKLLRLRIQAYSLGISYEFDPYFGLSISRVDPLPHQPEAVSDYLLKLPRVRFLLADVVPEHHGHRLAAPPAPGETEVGRREGRQYPSDHERGPGVISGPPP